jgi:hypothetical protein
MRVARLLLLAAVVLPWSGAQPAGATTVCAEHLVVGRLCVQDDPNEPVTCEQTGALATCDLLGDDPCDQLALCYVCPTGTHCGPPPAEP